MRIFYAGDVHGSERCFRKFLNAAGFYKADMLIMGGDITGKVLTPLVETKPGRYVAHVMGRTEKAKRPDDVAELEEIIRFNGFYPYRCSPEEYERLNQDSAYREDVITQVMIQEVQRWVALADDRLQSTGVSCLIMPGNDDEFEIDDYLQSEVVQNPDGQVLRIGDYQIMSCSWANPTPWNSPREAPEDQLAARLHTLADQLDPELPAVFNLHVPPYDSGLDTAAQLDSDFRTVNSGGQPNMIPVGSRAVREIIDQRQPVLGLHGHIHESRGEAQIGRTLCLNPGSNYADGVLDGALIDLDGTDVERYQFVSG